GELGGARADADAIRVAAQRDHAGVALDIDLLHLRILGQAILHRLLDVRIVGVHGLALRRGHHLQLVLHALDAVDALGDRLRRGLGLSGVHLASQHDHAMLRLDADLTALDSLVGEEGDLRLRREPGVAHRALGAVTRVLGLVACSLHLLLDLVTRALSTCERRRSQAGRRRQHRGTEEYWITRHVLPSRLFWPSL